MADELCQKVDEALRAYLRCVDSYQTAQAEVEAACKAGVMDMSRARRSMGQSGRAVSQLQYPARIKSRVRVTVDENREGGVIQIDRDPARSIEADADLEPVGGGDPIRWFGVLVPQHLRSSQKSFVRGLESAVLAANAAVEMQAHYARYQELLAQKQGGVPPAATS